jgi:hypothetical protein
MYIGCKTEKKNHKNLGEELIVVGRKDKLPLVLASSQSVLVSDLGGTHDHIFLLSKTFACFEMGPSLRREEMLD